ncbi:MAG: thiamine phosphate synthase, partial [Cyanobacteria bacterium Co-bin8]|nr:thiamine phosphate synthase [Cyanobacteria bacterium Co-bin8]
MQERYFERGLGEPVQFTELAIFRILDANLDRAREGLRIVEEWCRFGLNHGVMTEQIKHLRQTLAQW